MASKRKKQKKAAEKQSQAMLDMFDATPNPPCNPNPKMLRCMCCHQMNRVNEWQWYCFKCQERAVRDREELNKFLIESRAKVPPPK